MTQWYSTKRMKGLRWSSWLREHWRQVLAIAVAIVLSAVLVLNRDRVVELSGYSYLGVFLISVISSATIVIPVPGMIVVVALGAVLNPWLVGIISGIGATIGETTGYLLGYGGRAVIKDNVTYERIVWWMRRWGGWTIFVLALIPNPLFDIAGMAAGVLRFPLWKFYLFGAAGRIPKHILAAFGIRLLGILGVGW